MKTYCSPELVKSDEELFSEINESKTQELENQEKYVNFFKWL